MFVTWLSTFDCNAYCRFCSTHALKKKFPETLSRARSLEIAHEIGRARTWVVGFTGGEVLMWPYLFDIIDVLKSYKVMVYIVTNGWLLKENAQEIINHHVDTVVVSVDSLDPNEHDHVRVKRGLFMALMEGIEEIKRLRKNKRPLIKTTTVMTKVNLKDLDDIVDKLKSIVDIPSLQPLADGFANAPHNISDKNKGIFGFQFEDRTLVEQKLGLMRKKYRVFNNRYFKKIPDYIFNPEGLLEVKCWSPTVRMQIMPTGDVVHCSVNPRYSSIGNLKNSSFLEVWNSEEMKRQREEIRQHKNNCICWCQDSSFNSYLDSIPLMNSLPILGKKKVGGVPLYAPTSLNSKA